MSPLFTRSIIDIFHGDTVDIPLLANNGVVACMMKATQGAGYTDPTFHARYSEAKANSLLVGSYHFADGSDPASQASHWLAAANPEPQDALEFDWEDNGANSMSYAAACVFVKKVHDLTGRYPLLYGSNFLKEKIPSTVDSILFKCPLSLASYSAAPKIPRGWKNYTLWQYTGDNANASISPHTFPGASNPLDIYQYDGTINDLKSQWPFALA